MADRLPSTPPVAPPRLVREVISDTQNLAPVRKAIEQFCVDHGFGPTASGEIGLVVNEAMANVIRHAYAGASDGKIRVEAEFADCELRVMLRDWGNGAMPAGNAPPRDPLAIGGIGMICLRQLMHDVRFTPQPDGMLLTMTRKRDQPLGPGQPSEGHCP